MTRSRRQLRLFEVETDPSRVGTVRAPVTASHYSAGNSAHGLKSEQAVSPDALRQEMLAVLTHAKDLLRKYGWVRGEYQVDERGAPRPAREGEPLTLVDALNSSPVSAARWEARNLLQRVAGAPSLPAWNAHPHRKRREVLALLDAGVSELRGELPRIRRGGWTVSTHGEAMKTKSKKCAHAETRWPQAVGKRVLACCTQCGQLVPVESPPAKR